MKVQVQETGIRRWFGSDYISLQNELYVALEGFFEPYGNMIIKGCETSDNGDGTWRIGAGLVGLYSPLADEYRICRVAQSDISNTHAAVYLTLTSSTTLRPYKTGGSKAVVKEYKAQINTVQPGSGEFLTINANGNNITFRDAIQSANYRMVTDAKISTWDNIINTIRGGVSSGYDTLEKLRSYVNSVYNSLLNQFLIHIQDTGGEVVNYWSVHYEDSIYAGHETEIKATKFKNGMVCLTFHSNFPASDFPNAETWTNTGDIFLLPEDFRPLQNVDFYAAGSLDGITTSYHQFQLTTAGKIANRCAPSHGAVYYMTNLSEDNMEQFEI
jgi:hypothetical protein